jgi:hypothetical protein
MFLLVEDADGEEMSVMEINKLDDETIVVEGSPADPIVDMRQPMKFFDESGDDYRVTRKSEKVRLSLNLDKILDRAMQDAIVHQWSFNHLGYHILVSHLEVEEEDEEGPKF